jgi:uncharacterized protein (TIGR02453 family)
MLQASTIQFLKQLKLNNHKPWMDEHRKQYEAAKQDFEHLVQQLIEGIGQFDAGIASLSPKECIFRLNRDVRFSNNKDPYKTNFGAAFTVGGKKAEGAGYYLHIEPDQSFIGGGCWMPQAPILKNIRQEIDYNFTDFEAIVHNKDFQKTYGLLTGEKLKKAPQGYPTDHAGVEYLKHKSFTAMHNIKDSLLTSDNAVASYLQDFKTLHPLIAFLNRAL